MTVLDASLLRNSRWWQWSAAVGLTRLPPAMAPLASIFAGRETSGSYAFGALLAGSYALCESLGAPRLGRALDRCPPDSRAGRMRSALVLSGTSLTGLAVAVYAAAPSWLLVLLTMLAAFSSSGVPGGYRAMLTELVSPAQLLTALSWDATLLEAEWLIGPILVALTLAGGQPAVAYLVMAGCAIGAALLSYLVPSTPERPAAERSDARGAWRHRASWPCYLTSGTLGTAEGGFIAALPALLTSLHGHASAAGLFAALLGLASMIGGVGLSVLQSRLVGGPGRLADWSLLIMCASLGSATLVPSVYWLVVPVLAGGLFIAPVNALRGQALEQTLPAALRSEGFSFQYGAYGVGAAAGSALVALVVASSAHIAVVLVLAIPALLSAASLALQAGRGAVLARRDAG
ncbi:MFS transporter [Jatrophihabitans sp.]|jgi:predicted MFS family arabinose efflux permease|uniref:MFS transporter n=1 Tax=Jatrophihabitans sp. TaxID=1932789 RepID=UPI002EEEA755